MLGKARDGVETEDILFVLGPWKSIIILLCLPSRPI